MAFGNNVRTYAASGIIRRTPCVARGQFVMECLRGPHSMLLPKNKLQWFQAAKSRAELAILLDIKHKDLTYLLYVKKDPEKYKIFPFRRKVAVVEISMLLFQN